MKFLKNGDAWSLTPDGRMDVRDRLPAGNYTVCRNPLSGEYFLEETAAFTLPPKLYGKTERHAERILSTFKRRAPGAQIGVCLSGTKGSGKTLLAKHIAKTSELPVIIVNTPFSDERFMRTMQGIEQEAVIIFDEFEKLYDSDAQESILTLFDGVFTARNKVMVITCNNKYAVQSFFHNRPSRLRYSIAFEGLGAEFIREYCEDVLKDCHSYLDKIINLAVLCDEFNFDMLQTLVDELNRYGGEFEDAVEILNVKPLGNSKSSWTLAVTTPDLRGKKWSVESGDTFNTSPIIMVNSDRWDNEISVRIQEDLSGKTRSKQADSNRPSRAALSLRDMDESEEEDLNTETLYFELRQEHLFQVDPYKGVTVFRVEDDGIAYHFAFTEKAKGGAHNYNVGRFDF
jgi:hypothetical protein